MILHLDIETFSRCDLKKSGLYRYAEDDSTDLLCACYAFDDGPVHLWIPILGIPPDILRGMTDRLEPGAVAHYSEDIPLDLGDHIMKGGEIRAYNAPFELNVLNHYFDKKHIRLALDSRQMRCVMAKARNHGIPGTLDEVAERLGTRRKNQAGVNDMRYLCKPRADGTRPTMAEEPARFLSLYSYCMDDVRAEREVDDAIPDLTPAEQSVWELDQRINSRGVATDIPANLDAQFLVDAYKEELTDECRKRTGYNPTQTAKLADWVRDNGYLGLTDMQVPTIQEAVKDPACPEPCKYILKLFSTINMKSVAKYAAMRKSVCKDGRLRGMFLYYGASTGRWASLIVQLQNMMRPVIDDASVAIDAFKARSLSWIRALYPGVDPMKVFGSAVRGMLVAAAGHDILALDLESIEARIVAWLADQRDILEVFRGHGKIYEHTASKIYRKAIELIDAAERFIGKIAVLALGYQGGAAAFAKMAKNFNVDIDPALADQIKIQWREANPNVVKLWYGLEEAMKAAIENPGQIYKAAHGKIMFKVQDYKGRQWLYMRLPSGRRLAYFRPAINADGQATYMGVHTYTRQWCRVDTYGGKTLQNAAEGIARDLLVNGLFELERGDYPAVGSVHDEGITEPEIGHGSLAEAIALFTKPLPWAEGLPVKAKGFRDSRYRK